jgi:hypothetical protein
MEEMRNAYEISLKKPEGNSALGKPLLGRMIILWQVDLLLGNNRKRSSYTTAVTE